MAYQAETTPLADNDVHVWHMELDQPPDIVRSLYHLLAEDERRRAADFRFDQHRERFIVAHGLLRSILSAYTQCEPEALQFSTSTYGKPELSSVDSGKTLHFNISHSENQALFAFAVGRPVGIDIEYIRPVPNLDEVAATVFSPREQLILKSLPVQERAAAFFNGWTRKEALLKALGSGFSFPPQDIEVSLVLGEPVRVHSIKGNQHLAAQWHIEAITSISGYAAALAIEGTISTIAYYQAISIGRAFSSST
jgi:4'-phosphopantetheinyl transferase